MKAICNGVDLTAYVAQGYTFELEPQYGDNITVMDGTDYTAKLRDRVKITVPFIPLTAETARTVLQLFPAVGAYVNWTYEDLRTGEDRTISAKYNNRTSTLQCVLQNGVEYYSGLVFELIER